MKTSSFIGFTRNVAMAHPFVSSYSLRVPGIPFAIDLEGRQIIGSDIWYLKKAGLINSTFVQFFGPKGCGKSAIQKMWAAFAFMRRGADMERNRIVIHDRKPEGEASEYAKLAAITGSITFEMGSMQVNPFERKLFLNEKGGNEVYELGMLDIAKILAEYSDGPLSPLEYYALRVAMFEMLTHYDELVWSPEVLQKICGSLTSKMLSDYHSMLNEKLIVKTIDRLANLQLDVLRTRVESQINELKEADHLLQFADLHGPAISLSAKLGNLLNGKIGRMFGFKHSLYDIRTQRAVVKDWRGMDDEAETLARWIDTNITINAAEMNRKDLLPTVELDDERHKSMRNTHYANSLLFLTEIARGLDMVNVGSSHWYNSMRPGKEGDASWNVGDLVIRNMGLRIYGNITNETSYKREVQEREQASNREVNRLATLPIYCFGGKLQGENGPMTFFRTIASPKLRADILETDSAVAAMTKAGDLRSDDFLRCYARKNNFTYIG